MSGAKDPDEFIKLKGADAFRNLLEASENQIDYRLRSVTEKYDMDSDEQKVEFLKEATDMVARLPGTVERQVYSMRVASMAGISPDAVSAEVERRRKRLWSSAQKAEAKQQSRPERQAQPLEKELRYDDPASAAAEEGIIRLLYLDPGLAKSASLPGAEEFSSSALGRIYSVLLKRLNKGDSVSAAALGEELSSGEMSLLVRIIQKPEILSHSDKALADYIGRMRDIKAQKSPSSDLRALADKYRQKKGYEG